MLCQRDEDEPLFLLDATLAKTLRQELIVRKLYSFAAADVTTYNVVAPGGALEFVRADGEWTYPADPYVRLDQTKIDTFMEGVAGLTAERFVQYGGADAESTFPAAPVTITITLAGGETHTLLLDQHERGVLPRVALLVDDGHVVMLRQPDVEKLLDSIDVYVASAAPSADDG